MGKDLYEAVAEFIERARSVDLSNRAFYTSEWRALLYAFELERQKREASDAIDP